MLNDNNFEEHTQGFVPATTIADTKKSKTFLDAIEEHKHCELKLLVDREVVTIMLKGSTCKPPNSKGKQCRTNRGSERNSL